ncbi:MAG: FimV/HubP family polar landmark protein [Halothiobacillaceae bacterium]
MRKLSWVMAGAVAAIPAGTLATDLGQARVESYLAQPLRAVIPLVNLDADEIESVSVRLADQSRFEATGLDWHSVAGNIEFELLPDDSGATVEVTSRREMREPIVSFLVELKSPDGIVVREYNLLLDPPDRAPTRVRPAAEPPAPAAPSIEMGATYGPIPRGATLYGLAEAARAGTDLTQQQMMRALVASNPQAFVEGNPERMLAGVMLKVPGEESVAALERHAATDSAAEAGRADGKPAAEELADAPRVQVMDPLGDALASPEPEQDEPAAEAASKTADETAEDAEDQAREKTAGDAPAEQADSQPADRAPQAAAPLLPAIDLPMDALGGTAGNDEALSLARAENDRLSEQLDSVRSQIARVEELLTLRDEQVDRLEKMLEEEEARAETMREQLRAIQQDLLYFWGPYLLAAAGLLILLLLLLLWRSGRRARRAESSERHEPALDSAVPAAAVVAPVVASAPPDERATGDSSDEAGREPELAPDVPVPPAPAVDLSGELASGDEVQECIQEAEVLTAYGLTDQAGQLMSDMLASHPERDDLRLRLIRLWGEAGEMDRFVAEAEQLHQRVSEDSAEWQEVAELGRSVAPGHALFGGEKTTAASAGEEEDLPMTDERISPTEVDFGDIDVATSTQERAQPKQPAPAAEEPSGAPAASGQSTSANEVLEPLEFDLSFPEGGASGAAAADVDQGAGPAPAPVDGPPEQTAPSEREPAAPGTIDFDMDDFKPKAAPPEQAPAEEAPGAAPSAAESELTLELPGEEFPAPKSPAPQAADTAPDLDEPLDFGDVPGPERDEQPAAGLAGDNSDADATKVGLAEAFLEMGDQESARMMLEEVVEAGGAHAGRARELLDGLDGR